MNEAFAASGVSRSRNAATADAGSLAGAKNVSNATR